MNISLRKRKRSTANRLASQAQLCPLGWGRTNGRSGSGWSASYRKSYLSAIKFLYRHFLADEDLPDHNPAILEVSPKIIIERGYALTKEDVRKLLAAPGSPRARRLVHWMFYAPSRLATFADARWSDIDLDAGTWEVGKGDQPDIFALNPPLLRCSLIWAGSRLRGRLSAFLPLTAEQWWSAPAI